MKNIWLRWHFIALCLAMVGGLHSEAGAMEANAAESSAAAASDESEEPAGPGSSILPPELIDFVEAAFPQEEADAGITESMVILLLSISETGEVVDVEVAQSGGEAFDRAAVEAGRQLRFAPATQDGVPIPVRIGFQYEYLQRAELERKSTSDLEGRTLDRWTRTPVPGVLVSLDTGEEAVTDADGFFRFEDLAPGLRVVTLSGDRIGMVITEERLEASHLVQAEYLVEVREEDEDEDELEIVISAPRIRKQVLSTEVLADQGRRVPGSQGDVLRVVENLPGVARAAAGAGELVVWGAAPQDTRTYVDGIRIPRLYHDGGYRSVLHSDLVRSVELIPGGYGPMYGRGLGGIVAVELKPLDEDFAGSLEVNGIDAAASTTAALGEKLHVAVAARRSHLESYVDTFGAPFTDRDVEEVLPIPHFLDGQLRLSYRLSQEEGVEFGFLASRDRIDHNLVHAQTAHSVRRRSGVDFYRLYARYENRAQNGERTSLVLSWGRDHSSLAELHGATPIQAEGDADVFGLRASWRGGVAPSVKAEVGLDIDWTFSSLSRFGSIGAPAREGDPSVFGRPPPEQINADDWETASGSFAPYALLDIGLFDEKLSIVPGLRLDPYVMQVSRSTPRVGELPAIAIAQADFVVEPRLSLLYTPVPFLTLKAAAGIYHQAPFPEDLSAVFGAPQLGLSSAEHWLAGATLRMSEGLSLELTGFATRSTDLPMRSRRESPALARALEQDGEGRSRGLQILLRQNPIGPFFGWLSYSISKSERKDGADGAWRLFDWDQRHVLTAVASFDLGAGFEVGGRFRLASGFPRTRVEGAYYDAALDRYQPIVGAPGSIHLPSFASLDLRASKRTAIEGTELEIYLDVQNVTNRENAEEFVYDPTFTRQGVISGFPLLPMLGAKWTW